MIKHIESLEVSISELSQRITQLEEGDRSNTFEFGQKEIHRVSKVKVSCIFPSAEEKTQQSLPNNLLIRHNLRRLTSIRDPDVPQQDKGVKIVQRKRDE